MNITIEDIINKDSKIHVDFIATGITMELKGKSVFTEEAFESIGSDGLEDFILQDLITNVNQKNDPLD